jgi:nitrosocyanin
MRSSILRHVLIISLIVLLALLMIGCESAVEDIIPEEDMEDLYPTGDDEQNGEEPESTEVEINVIAGNGFFDPDVITVEQGQTVSVTVENTGDIVHTFTIDELDVHVSLGPGEQKVVTFNASETGSFEFYCSEQGHRDAGMHGNLVVE